VFEEDKCFSCCCFGFWEEEELDFFAFERKKRNLGKEKSEFWEEELEEKKE